MIESPNPAVSFDMKYFTVAIIVYLTYYQIRVVYTLHLLYRYRR